MFGLSNKLHSQEIIAVNINDVLSICSKFLGGKLTEQSGMALGQEHSSVPMKKKKWRV